MIAASFWSLLAPAIELAESSGDYGGDGRYAFVPVAIGFLLGAVFVYATDRVITIAILIGEEKKIISDFIFIFER